MSQLVLLAVYLAGLVVVALIGAIVTPFITYLLNERAIEKQTTVLQKGQHEIKETVDATHEAIVNGNHK